MKLNPSILVWEEQNQTFFFFSNGNGVFSIQISDDKEKEIILISN